MRFEYPHGKNNTNLKVIDINLHLFKPSSDNIYAIYSSLHKLIIKPENISDIRFEKILKIKAQIFNAFTRNIEPINSALDELEKKCAENMIAFDKNSNSSNYAQPKNYIYTEKLSKNKKMIYPEYYPLITVDILRTHYPTEILTNVLDKQFRKNNINTPTSKKDVKLFSKNDGWHVLIGVVPFEKAITLIKTGKIFVDPPQFPDTDSRFHGAYSHAIQEYIISKLLETGYLIDLQVENESDINERDLLLADAWSVKEKNSSVKCLFDIMREKRAYKFDLLGVYPEQSFGFTSPDFLNQYLMLNSIRYPTLSTLTFNWYAHSTCDYFSMQDVFFKKPNVSEWFVFEQLSMEDRLTYVNTFYNHYSMRNDASLFMKESSLTLIEKTPAMVWDLC